MCVLNGVLMALTDSFLRSVAGKESDAVREKSDRDGLSVRISKKGKLVFQMRYMRAGKQRRLDIGTYPGMTLKDARDETVTLRRVLEEGKDPAGHIANRIADNQKAMTVEEVVRDWDRVYATVNIKRHSILLRSFEIHVFPSIGQMKHDSVSPHVWMDLIDSITKKSPSIARRILSTGIQAHSWALRRSMVKTTPLEGVSAKDMGIKRNVIDRVLDDSEIRLLFEVLEHSRMTQKNKLFMMLVLLFGCRSGELIAAKVSHFDFERDIWSVPPENHKGGKSGKPLLRPITPAAKVMIKEAMKFNGGSEFLFERALKGNFPDRPMDSASALSLPKTVKSWVLTHKGLVMKHWTMHDLRRTARTRWAVLAPPHVCEIMLGHKLPGIWSVYDHNDYLEEQRKAYVAWWDEVCRIVGRSILF